jgi:glutathione S-transferase
MKLYTAALSPYSAKVRAVLREKGIAFESIELPWAPAGFVHKPEEMLRLNPRAQVPVLVEGDFALYDSTVILEYLEDRFPTPALYPQGAKAKASSGWPTSRASCRSRSRRSSERVPARDTLWCRPGWRA